MAIGAREFIDKLLVEKYAQEKVDNMGLIVKIVADYGYWKQILKFFE